MADAQLGAVLRELRRMVQAEGYDDRSDGELLEQFVAQREEAAFVALLKRHGPMVLHLCRRLQGNEHDAEDIFQATFLLLARKAGSLRKPESVASWLYGVAHRLALAAKQQGARRQARERRAAAMRKTAGASDAAWQELQTTLDEALRQVPEKYRAPLLLCYLEGRTQEEAARQLGCPLGTVRSRLARGRSRLKTVLERKGVRLSATALAAAVAAAGAPAAVGPTLLNATARAALAYAAGKAAAALVSARAAALVEVGLQALAAVQLKLVTAVVLAVGVFGLGAAVASHELARPARVTAEARPPTAPGPQGGAPPPAANREPPAASRSEAGGQRRHEITVRGRVLDSAGKPLAGARLLLLGPGDKPAELGTSGPGGRFAVGLPKDATGPAHHQLAAHAAGFGVDWVDLSERKASEEVTFRLPKDVPITGRVVNTEGKPVAGVSVSADSIAVPANEDLDDYLRGWLRDVQDNLATPRKYLYGSLNNITGAVMTDPDGRFTLRGAGTERIVPVTFEGGGVARSTPYVITRPGFDPRPYNDVLRKKQNEDLRVLNRFLGLYPPSLTFVAEVGKTVAGVVKDAASGKPLAGCLVDTQTGYGERVWAVSDANGKYRLGGLSKNGRGYSVAVNPPRGSAFLRRIVQAADTEGYRPVQLDIGLAKGVVVSGRVVDRQTGKGVQAGIRFAPLADNAFFGSKPGFDNYRSDRLMDSTDKEGRFRLLTIPGRTLIMAQPSGSERFQGSYLCPYRRAVPEPEHKDLFTYDGDDDAWRITTAGGSLEFLGVESAVKVITVPESGETRVELSVDRGVTARISVQDAQGQPLAGAWVAGLTDMGPSSYHLAGSTATVFALNPEKPRTLVVYHPEKRLGGTVVIRGNEKEPVVAKLGPVGKVAGRLLDTDGSPLAGAEVSINARSPIARELYRSAPPTGQPAVTDRDGRFTLTGVIPAMPFYVQTRKGENYFGGRPKIGLRQLRPGEHLDLGDRTMELLQ